MWTDEQAHTQALVECLREMDFDEVAALALSARLHYRVTTGEIGGVASFIERLMDEREVWYMTAKQTNPTEREHSMPTKQTNPTETTPAPAPQPADPTAGLVVGRIVHYVDHAQQCRAAIVTHVPLGEDGTPEPDGLCSVQWFDFAPHAAGNVRYKALVAGEEPTPHSWHWFGNQAGASH